jgi:phage-related protein
MGYSFTLLDRNFYDITSATVVQNVYMADYGVYLGKEGSGLWKDVLIPPKRHYTEQIYGMPGMYFFGQDPTERKIQLPCYVQNIDENRLRDIQDILALEIPTKLQDDIRPYRYIWITLSEQIDFDFIRANNYSGLFVLNCTCYDPYYYSFYTSLEEANLEYDDAQLYYDSGLLYGDVMTSATPTITSTSDTFQLYNAGNANAVIKITLTNNGATSLTNIVLTNTENNESFTISTLAAGASVVVDGNKGQVTNLSETVLLTSLHSGKFIQLKPKYNDFTITLTGSGVNLALSFDYRHTYL